MKPKFILLSFIFSCFSFVITGQSYKRPPNLPEYDQKRWHFGFTLGPEYQTLKIANNSNNLGDKTIFPDFPDIEVVPIFADTNKDGIDTRLSSDEEIIEAIYYSEVVNQKTPGFHVGIILSRRLNDYLNLRIIPSLSLGQKDISSKAFIQERYTIADPDHDKYGETDYRFVTTDTLGNAFLPTPHTIRSTYITCPVLIKYKSVRIDNFRPYLVAGANIKYDLSTSFDDPITLKSFDTSLEFGLGSDFYLQTFRLGIELRFGIGMFNILSDRPEEDTTDEAYLTSSIETLRAKTFTIAINFE